MTKRQIFYSFHFDNDVMRVQLVRNMGVVEGNTPVSPNTWEEVKQKGNASIEKWIDENLKQKSCLIVLIGKETANRKWVKYEIEKAWKDGKGIFAINVHNLNCPRNGKGTKGANPFDSIKFTRGTEVIVPKVYDPKASDAYNDIAANMSNWVEAAIKQAT